MESLSAGLRGLGSMVARATTGAGSGGDQGPGRFALGLAGMIGAEWTDGGLQLWLIGADGAVEATHSAVGVGVCDLGGQAQHFESVFEQQVRVLEQQQASGAGLRPALVCGAAGRRGGWCETPCIGLPAGVKQLASAAKRVPTASGRVVFVVPGCELRAGDLTAAAPAESASDCAAGATNSTVRSPHRLDVLRGQETLVMGTLISAVLHQQPGTVFRTDRLFCLLVDEDVSGPQSSEPEPSVQHRAPTRRATQSAWVSTKDGAINWFRSYRTGIACDALASSAKTMCAVASVGSTTEPNAASAVEQGLVEGLAAQESLLHQLVYLSTAPLVGELSGADGPPYLAGLLVGHEVQDAINLYRRHQLCGRLGESTADVESSRQARLAALGSEPGAEPKPSVASAGGQTVTPRPVALPPVTLCGAQNPTFGLLPLYNLALERYGCNVEKEDQDQTSERDGSARAMPAGLFAIGNSLSALEKQREAERQAAAAAGAQAGEASPSATRDAESAGR